MRYGMVNHKVLDTTPGSEGPFSPPLGFSETTCSYRSHMIGLLRDDCGVRQHVAVVARRLVRTEPPVFTGPYAEQAERMAWEVLSRLAAPPPAPQEE